MFSIPRKVLSFWQDQDAQRQAAGREPAMAISAEEFRRIESVWGFALPEAYKRFLATYGAVEFPEAFSVFDYVRKASDGKSAVRRAISPAWLRQKRWSARITI